MAFSSSISSTNGQLSKNVTIPFISDQTSLDTTFQENIDNDVQYNVTMIAVNAIGASQPSTPILFTKTQGIQTQGTCVCVIGASQPVPIVVKQA